MLQATSHAGGNGYVYLGYVFREVQDPAQWYSPVPGLRVLSVRVVYVCCAFVFLFQGPTVFWLGLVRLVLRHRGVGYCLISPGHAGCVYYVASFYVRCAVRDAGYVRVVFYRSRYARCLGVRRILLVRVYVS